MLRRLGTIFRQELLVPFVGAVFAAMNRDVSPVTFVQVGSNDAGEGDILKDHIRSDGWRGVMIEPVPYIFDRLQRAWSDLPTIAFENVAISDRAGTFPFYAVPPDDTGTLPGWYDQIGSFDRSVVMKTAALVPALDERIVEIAVPTITVMEVVAKHALERVDVLQIDTEGHDLKIVQSIDFGVLRPALIFFEHKHLSRDDRARALALLQGNGYATRVGGADTAAFDLAARARYAETYRAFTAVGKFVPGALVRSGRRTVQLALKRLA